MPSFLASRCEISNINVDTQFKIKLTFSQKTNDTKPSTLIFSGKCIIHNFPENIFSDYQHFTQITLDNCATKELKISNMIHNSSIQVLSLNNNHITQLDSHTMSQLGRMEQFWANNNQIRTITRQTFSKNSLLQTIDFGFNRIEILPEFVFHDLVDLTYLGLNSNKIKSLPNNLFRKNLNLTFLYLDRNEIEYINKNLFLSLKKINLISLYGNKIKQLGFDLGEFLHNNLMIYQFKINGNNWNCPSLIKYVNAFKKRSITYGRDDFNSDVNYEGIKCVKVGGWI